MELTGNIISILFLIWTALQDFRSRSVYAWLLPAVGASFLLSQVNELNADTAIMNGLINAGLLTLQLFCVWLVLCAKRRTWIRFIDSQIGLGDILFLFFLTPAFSPINYTLFIVAATLFSILFAGVLKVFRLMTDPVPFAGLLAVPLMAVCTIRIIDPRLISLTSDDWFLTLITGQ